MVRSVARGQFRVTGAWNELAGAPQGEPVEEPAEAPVPMLPPHAELALPSPEATDLADPAPPEDEPPPSPLEPASATATDTPPSRPFPRGQFRVTFGWPEHPPPSSPVRPTGRSPETSAPPPPRLSPDVVAVPTVAPPDAARSHPTPSPSATPATVIAPEAPATEPTRTLASLLARMWLMRAGTSTSQGVALATPSPPSPPEPPLAAPSPPMPPPPSIAPALPLIPPELAPTPRPSAPELLPTPDRPTRLAPDDDDRRPLSGLATFLVEVAELTHPATPAADAPTGTGASPLPPPAVLHPREYVVARPVHCHHPIPERSVSRDACRLWRYGR